MLTVLTGLFVLAWLAVLVLSSREQILRRIHRIENGVDVDADAAQRSMSAFIGDFRQELADDRRADLAKLEERITSLTAEYGEQRETDGYINGMRVATSAGAEHAQVHPIRRGIPKQ